MGVFISFSSKDLDQAELLVSLLEFHGIDVWFSSKNLRAGKFPQAINQALLGSDSLVVLVSENTPSSKWVSSEIAAFLQARPGAPVLPILLDNTRPSQVARALGEYQHFKFSFEGLEKAFACLHIRLLDRNPRASKRRAQSGRRKAERRKFTPDYRLRKGLWLAYYKAKEPDKFDPISPHPYALIETREILTSEVRRYSYLSKQTHEEIQPEDALRIATDIVWHKMKERPLGGIFVMEAIAAQICADCEVSIRDRRGSVDRRSGDRRRAAKTQG